MSSEQFVRVEIAIENLTKQVEKAEQVIEKMMKNYNENSLQYNTLIHNIDKLEEENEDIKKHSETLEKKLDELTRACELNQKQTDRSVDDKIGKSNNNNRWAFGIAYGFLMFMMMGFNSSSEKDFIRNTSEIREIRKDISELSSNIKELAILYKKGKQ